MSSPESLLLQLWVIPEWRDHYIAYTVILDDFKQLLDAVPELQFVSKHHALMRSDHRPATRSDGPAIVAATSTLSADVERGITSQFDQTIAQGMQVDLGTSVTMRREKLAELLGHTAFDNTDTFNGHASFFERGPTASRHRPLRMYVKVVLSDELNLIVTYIEYRVGRRLVQESCSGVTSDGVERFQVFDELMHEHDPRTPTIEHDLGVHRQAHMVFRTLHEVNHLATSRLKEAVEVVVGFYRRKSRDVAGAVFVLAELGGRIDTLTNRERDKMERIYRRTYFTIQMLQEYCDNNHLIVTQLVEKFVHDTHQVREASNALDHLIFCSAPHYGPLALLEGTLANNFASVFCDGDEDAARERLKLEQVSGKEALAKPKVLLEIGTLLGLIVGFGVASIVLYSYSIDEYQQLKYSDSDLFMFGVSGILILLAILFALDVVVWEYYDINFVFSLHLNPVKHFTGLVLLRDHLQYATVWCVILFCFMHAALQEALIDAELTGLATSAEAVLGFINHSTSCAANATAFAKLQELAEPSQYILYQHTTLRSWVWAYTIFPVLAVLYCAHWFLGRHKDNWFSNTMLRVLLTPVFAVEFPDFFICEQLVSLSSTLFEIQFLWCTFHSSSVEDACNSARGDQYWVLLILPSIWRVLQSLRRYRDEPFHRSFYPHLLNATKYLINCIAYSFYALIGVSKYENWSESAKQVILVMFFITFFVDMVFKCWYELWIEFGVLRRGAKYCLIRDKILFPQWSYYVASIANVLLRSLWVIKYFTEKQWTTGSRWTFPLFAVTEILRRAIWNLYRVEHDQVSNIESYKLVTFAPSMHHEVPQKALWEVRLEDVQKGLPNTAEVVAFFDSSKTFFKYLSRRERTQLLNKINENDTVLPAEAKKEPFADAELNSPTAPVEDKVVTVVGGAHEHHPKQADSTPSVDRASPARPILRERMDFVTDPRTGMKKTTLMYFSDMYEEDRVRAILFHMDGRTLQQYLDDLIRQGDLDARFLDELHEALAAVERPKRSGSSLVLRRGPSPLPTMAAVDAVMSSGEQFAATPPSRQVSFMRRQQVQLVTFPPTTSIGDEPLPDPHEQ